MSYTTNHKQKFTDLKLQIENQDQLRKQANGGNSILFSYTPGEENLYIAKAKEQYVDKAAFIDVSKLFVQVIDENGWESFKDYYKEMEPSPHKVFFDKDSSERDLFDLIIGEVEKACQNDQIPFLVRTGCLYGTGIDNINIMDNKTIRSLPHPLVIFYPGRIEDDNIYFLNFKPASKYRCTLIK